MSSGLLEVEKLGFAYRPPVRVLDGVDLQVNQGEVVALAGPNGSGKSTLLRCAAGLRHPQQGGARLAGRPLEKWSREERAQRLAFLPQRVEPLYDYRVRDVVELARFPHGSAWGARLDDEDRAVVEAALRRCEVEGLASRVFDTLSGGERQRVLLAAALAQRAQVLLLDEPTTALDLHHQVSLLRDLVAVAREGCAVLLATHDLNLAAGFADRVVLLHRGRVAAEGTPLEVFTEDRLGEVFGDGIRVGHHQDGTPWILPDPGPGARS